MFYILRVHPDAAADIEYLKAKTPRAAAGVVALLQQARIDQRLLESLSISGYGAHRTEDISVGKFLEQQRRGRNLWYLKIWDLEDLGYKYRVVYALYAARYTVLGVLPRSFNYDENDPLTQRVLRAYDSLGIPDVFY